MTEQESDAAFEQWWEDNGQFCRAGGGDYEKTFAYRAWQARGAQPVARTPLSDSALLARSYRSSTHPTATKLQYSLRSASEINATCPLEYGTNEQPLASAI